MAEARPYVRCAALSGHGEIFIDELLNRDSVKEEGDHEEEDVRFKYNVPDEFPLKSIALALFLLSLGSFFLLISHFLFSSHMPGDSSQAYGFLFLGLVTFLPGFYETRIAYYSWRKCRGYTFSLIPSF
ncbi:hypothetical protein R1sor_020169 [Riccia sorocarpa]|uniref:Transmembrane protein 230 n=1 Tax=Riccia sorocarpa TaxID=122646 RepID=A0ABD3IJ18_9MARC